MHGKFHSWKVFRLEDINENVPSCGSITKLTQEDIGNCIDQNWSFQPKLNGSQLAKMKEYSWQVPAIKFIVMKQLV